MPLLMHMRDSIKSAPRRKTVDKQTLRAEVFADLETALSAWWAPGDAALCRSWSRSQQLGNVCKWLDGVCGVLLTFRGMEKIKLKCKLDSRVESRLSCSRLSLSCSLCLNAYRLYTAYLPAATAYQQWQIVVNKNVAAACTHAQWDELVSVSVTYTEVVASLARPLRFTYLCRK